MKTSKAEDAEVDTGAAPPESLPEVTKGKRRGGEGGRRERANQQHRPSEAGLQRSQPLPLILVLTKKNS